MSLDQFLLSADTTDLNYPEVRPTLDLNFARVKALDPRITFTRASGGSYVGADGLIKLAGVNEPRFDHNPVTGESLGLLIEESRTNLTTYSEGFDDAAWTKINVTVTANATTAPDGTLTADRLLETATTDAFYVGKFYDTSTPGTYTASVFAKGDGSGRLLNFVLYHGGYSQSYFNLTTGVVSNVSAGLTASIQSLPNGWFRCSVTGTSVSFTTSLFYIAAAAGENSVSVTRPGSASAGIYLWGAQLEAGAFPTSYIPTVASSRTRAADEASITGKNFRDFYRQDEGVITCTYRSSKNSGNAFGAFVISNNTPDNRILHVSNGSAFAVGGLVITGGATQGNMSAGSSGGQGSSFKFGLGYKVNNFATTGNGSISTDTSGTSGSIPTVDRLDFGFFYPGLSSSNILNGTIARLTYYPKRLTNQQLQVLTR